MKKIQLILYFILSGFILYGQSSYEVKFTIPEYDAANPEHFLISKISDWHHINDVDKRFFYVKPGNYQSAGDDMGRVILTTRGTETAKRYISLYNGNDVHPGKLNRDWHAKVGFILKNTEYWVIDRMSYWEHWYGLVPVIINSSNHIIINRYYAMNINGGVISVRPGSDSNVIQNCRMEKDNIDLHMDRAAISLSNNFEDNITISNTIIVNNEIKNYVDGFQAIKTGLSEQVNINYEGTVVDYNHFYVDTTFYTDGEGHHDTIGIRSYTENAIDLKCGSENPDNPMVFSNNKMWGYRKADRENSHLDDPGIAFGLHFGVKNIIIRNNLIWDSNRGIIAGVRKNGKPALENAVITHNVIYDIKQNGVLFNYSDNLLFNHNLIKKTGEYIFDSGAYWGLFGVNHTFEYSDNLMVNNSGKDGARLFVCSDVTISNNKYYNSQPGQISQASDTIFTSDPTADYSDLVFITDRFTLNPRTITIQNIGDDISSDEVYIVPDLTSVKIENTSRFKIYPNPSNGIVNISLNKFYDNIDVEIVDITGSSIAKKSYWGTNKLTIKLNALAGVYFVIIRSDSGEISSSKLIIQ